MTLARRFLLLLVSLLLWGCSPPLASLVTAPAMVARTTAAKRELLSLPPPKGKVKVAVYNFRDQTGQYKPQPNVSSFSTAVTQGGTALLVQALKDSNWFIPLEREGLQNLLTERKIIRAGLDKQGDSPEELPPLETASLMIEGGVVGYDSNLVTGGLGARYFGLGGDVKYRVDQVTVNLRAVDVKTGRVLKSLSTSKTVLSREISAGIFRFVEFKRLLEAETGMTTNEPVLLAVQGAIEKAVFSLVVEGLREGFWVLKDARDMQNPAILDYLVDLRQAREPRSKIDLGKSFF